MARKPSGGQNRFVLWFGGLWLGVGLLFLGIGLVVGVQNARRARRFAAEGRTAQGMVLTKNSYRGSRNSAMSYHVEFRFETDSRVRVRSGAEVDSDTWDRLDERGPIRVTYLPDSPFDCLIAGQTSSSFVPWVFGGIGSIFTILGGIVLGVGWRSPTSRRRKRRA